MPQGLELAEVDRLRHGHPPWGRGPGGIGCRGIAWLGALVELGSIAGLRPAIGAIHGLEKGKAP